MTDHLDIHFHCRGRVCKKCGYKFLSGEGEKKFFDELSSLRTHVAKLRSEKEELEEQVSSLVGQNAELEEKLSGHQERESAILGEIEKARAILGDLET